MRLSKYFRLAGKQALALLCLLPIAALIEISVSYLLQIMTDTASGHIQIAYGVLVAVVVAYMVIDALAFFGATYLEQVVLNKIDNQVRLKLAQSLMHERTGLGDKTQRMTTSYYNDFTNTLDILHNDYLQGSMTAYK